MKYAFGTIVFLSLALNVFLWRKYDTKECIEQVINNTADTIYQTYYVPSLPEKVKGPGVRISTITNALNGTRKRGSIMFTGGLQYIPRIETPYSYDIGVMYFQGAYGIGYSYNPWLQGHQVRVGIKLGN